MTDETAPLPEDPNPGPPPPEPITTRPEPPSEPEAEDTDSDGSPIVEEEAELEQPIVNIPLAMSFPSRSSTPSFSVPTTQSTCLKATSG